MAKLTAVWLSLLLGLTTSVAGRTFVAAGILEAFTEGYEFDSWGGQSEGAQETSKIQIVLVTIRTAPFDLAFSVDSVRYTSPQTFQWEVGSVHTLGTTSPQSEYETYRYVWDNWGDGGSIVHTYTVTTGGTVVAYFRPQYRLMVCCSGSSGTVSPESGYYDLGTPVQITAEEIPGSGFTFQRWQSISNNGYSGPNNPATVVMNSPVDETAVFVGTPPTATPTLTPTGMPTVTPTATPPIIPVVIGTNVEQVTYSVDSQNYNSTRTFYWMPGSSHTVAVESPQSYISGTRYVWNRWSDDGPIRHSVSVNVQGPASIIADFTPQYLLTTCCNSMFGTVMPSTGFYDAGNSVHLTSNSGFETCFVDWQGSGNGSYTGLFPQADIIMHGPIQQTARLRNCGTPSPTNTPTATPTGTPMPTNTPTATPTATPTPVPVTVRTNVAGLAFTVDSETYTSAKFFNWPVGSRHSISIDTSPQGSSSSRYIFTNWSDGRDQRHTIIANSSATYTANFRTQYYLNICCTTQNWSISPAADFYDADTTLQIQATSSPGSGYNFWFWQGNGLGSYSGSNTTATVTMRGPIFQFANFVQGTPPPLRKAPFDYDGDLKTDISVYHPSNGRWFVERSRDGSYAWQFGSSTDKIVPADYDGEGKTDLAVYRPSQGVWYQYNSGSGAYLATQFGLADDIPAPGDYDGDGKADLAVFRPSSGLWYIQQSTAGLKIEQFGASSDVPVPGDYDGDGKNDLAVWRPSNGVWYERRSGTGDFAIQFGASADKVAPADYDGDRKTDVCVYRPSQGTWYSVNSTNGGVRVQVFGLPGDIPVPGNYDGDLEADIAVFRPSNRTWYINESAYGLVITQYGATGDKPTPSAFGN